MWFMQNALAKPDNAGAGATDYMHLFGLVAFGHMWAMFAKAANEKIAAGDGRAETLKSEVAIGRAFVERALPETGLRLARISAGSDLLMGLPEAAF
jgi:glutamate-1-semialdehyde aminotransferase